MGHEVENLPPFDPDGEVVENNIEFADECRRTINEILSGEDDVTLGDIHLSSNVKYGIVCRVDFSTPDDLEDTVNRIMLWRSSDGSLAEFVGLSVPAKKL